MVAEILCVGTELLLGQVLNTDAQFLSRQLSEMGIELYRIETVGDNPGRARQSVRAALERCDLLITTGGLGPPERRWLPRSWGWKWRRTRPRWRALTKCTPPGAARCPKTT